MDENLTIITIVYINNSNEEYKYCTPLITFWRISNHGKLQSLWCIARYERCAQFDDDCRDLVRGISLGCPTVFFPTNNEKSTWVIIMAQIDVKECCIRGENVLSYFEYYPIYFQKENCSVIINYKALSKSINVTLLLTICFHSTHIFKTS